MLNQIKNKKELEKRKMLIQYKFKDFLKKNRDIMN